MVRNLLVAARTVHIPLLAPLFQLGNRQLLLVCAACVTLALPGISPAAEWRITPSLQVTETYTDNVALAPTSVEKSDFISQINPGLSIDARGGRGAFKADYTLQNLIYASDRSRNSLNHLLSASGQAVVIPDLFFFDAQAHITRQIVSLLGSQGIDFTNDNRNTTETRTYEVSPYIRDRIGTIVDYQVRYGHNHVSTDSTIFSASDANRINVSARSGAAFSRTGWGIDYNKERVNNHDAQDTGSENIAAYGRYSLIPRFALLATAGYEKNEYAFAGPKPEGKLWNVGFAWEPSRLTSLTATSGERFFGKTYALNFVHRSRNFYWLAQYVEDISSTRAGVLTSPPIETSTYLDALASSSTPDPSERARSINNFIITNGLPATIFSPTNSFTDRNFLDKRFIGSVTYNTPKTTIILNVFRVSRDADAIGAVATGIITGDFAANVNTVQTGGSVLFNWRFAPRTGLDFSVGADKNHFRTIDRDDEFKYVGLGLRHQLQPKITGAIDYRRVERDSTDASANYTENAISAAVNIRF